MTKALILKITIEQRRPLTWRRLAVAPETSYAQLHQIIQAAFDWENRHLYAFYPAWNHDLVYDDPQSDDEALGNDVHLYQALPDLKQGTVVYEYDFGQSWQHRIKLEAIKDVPGQLPQCLAVRGNGFYEDSDDPLADEATVASVNQALQDLHELAAKAGDESSSSLNDQAIQAHLQTVVTTQLEDAWRLYQQSPQRAENAELPDRFIMAIMGMFASVAMQGKPFARWTIKDVEVGLVDILDSMPDESDTQASILVIVCDFLSVAAQHHLVPFAPEALDPLVDRLAEQFELTDDHAASAEDDLSDPGYATVTTEYGPAVDQFFTSLHWTQLGLKDQQAARDLILGFVTDVYEQTGRLIADWQPADIDTAFLTLYPRQVFLPKAQWPVLPQVLRAFIAFLQSQHAVAAKTAKRLQAAIKADTPEMLALNADHDNWGPGKQFAQQMQDAGVDLTDEGAVQAFIDQHAAADPAPFYVPALTPRPHVTQAAGKTWRQATATRVHNSAAELMNELPVGNVHAAADVVCDFVDQMYAATLQTPLQWQASAVAQAWQAHLGPLPLDTRHLHTDWLTMYCTALGDATSLSKKQAANLAHAAQQAFNRTPKPAAHQNRQPSQSKVVPFRKR